MRWNALAIAGVVMAAAVPAAMAAPGASSIQQEFEAGTAALRAEKWDDALAVFDGLEKRIKSGRSLALVRIRKGNALYHLGRYPEAVALIKQGLADLPADDASLREDRFTAFMLLGDADMAALDYASALGRYRQADAMADAPGSKARVAAFLASVGTFVDPQAALADADRALALAQAIPVDTASIARLQITRARVLLNLGRFKEAQAEAGKAVSNLGGLTRKVTPDDVTARSDYAAAAMLAGDQDNARKYLAYTGAGRLPKQPFEMDAESMLPPCGGAEGFTPDELAVVEFSIRDDGTVGFARPIYASRQGNMALIFADAVQEWLWTPEAVKDIPPFFRMLTRLELHCSTLSARPSALTVAAAGMDEWLKTKGVSPDDVGEAEVARPSKLIKSGLAAQEAKTGADSIQTLPLLMELAFARTTTAEEGLAYAQRALTIGQAHGAPPLARLILSNAIWMNAANDKRTQGAYVRAIEAGLKDPAFAGDPAAQATLRLMLVDRYPGGRKKPESIALLNQVTADRRLGPHDPLRVGALIRLASLYYALKDIQAARARYAETGLSAQQCALVDARPSLVKADTSSSSYPKEALRWGFDGWVKMQFDVQADGRSTNQKTLVAYPPFVFGASAAKIIRGAQFEQSYRPEGGLGCGGSTQRISFNYGG